MYYTFITYVQYLVNKYSISLHHSQNPYYNLLKDLV